MTASGHAALLLAWLFSIGGFATLGAIAVVWMLLRPRSTAPRRAVAAIVLLYAAASTRVVPWIASRPLVAGFHRFADSGLHGGSAVVILLGGGSFTVHQAYQRLSVLDQNSAARVLEAAHVYRLFDSAWIVSSGGATSGFDLEPVGVTMRDALVELGVPLDRILVESSSRNTRDEALLIAPMLRTLHADRTVLVTTDIHMRRALATFRAAGIDAIPAVSADPLTSASRMRSFIPTIEGVRFTDDVIHEYAGLAEYAVRGWLRFSS